MAKYKVINIDIYKRDVTVFVGSHEELQDWMSSNDVPSSWEQVAESIIESEDDALASYWYNVSNGNGIIELPWHPKTPKEIAAAAHEALHSVMRVLSFVGIPCVANESNEAYTYLLEYILEKILDYDNYKIINI